MKNRSIWKDIKIPKEYPSLKENITVDILVVGGGITGISTIYHLDKTNKQVCLVEKNKIGFGVTSNTTGKLTYLQDNILGKVKEKDLYLKSQIEAINIAKNIIEDNNIACDFEMVESYLFATNDKNINKIKEIKDLLLRNNIKVKENTIPLVKTNYSISVEDTYTFHPLKFIYSVLSLINNVDIYEKTKIKNIKKVDNYYICETDTNTIKAKQVAIATHYPYFIIPYLFPIKSKLEKSYISASKYNIEKVSAISYDKPTISFRKYNNYVIYLNGSHNLANRLNYKDNFKDLKLELNQLNLKPDYLWSNKDIITNDYLPYIGYIKDNMLIATGFNTWGMTNGILAGKIITDIVLNNKNDFISLFDPIRGNNFNLVADTFSSASAYIKAINKKDSKIEYKVIDNKEIGIYKDSKGLHKVYTTCPHLKCKLIFNEVEKTWDCPCHGSRFDIDGKTLEGPSNYNISVKNE